MGQRKEGKGVEMHGVPAERPLVEFADAASAAEWRSRQLGSFLARIESKVKWWVDRAKTRGVEPFPLNLEMINLAGALLKAGGYRSSAQYFSAMKREHITKGHPWQDVLQQGVADAVRSCVRGLGPDRSCPSLDLRKLENQGDGSCVEADGTGHNHPKGGLLWSSVFIPSAFQDGC